MATTTQELRRPPAMFNPRPVNDLQAKHAIPGQRTTFLGPGQTAARAGSFCAESGRVQHRRLGAWGKTNFYCMVRAGGAKCADAPCLARPKPCPHASAGVTGVHTCPT